MAAGMKYQQGDRVRFNFRSETGTHPSVHFGTVVSGMIDRAGYAKYTLEDVRYGPGWRSGWYQPRNGEKHVISEDLILGLVEAPPVDPEELIEWLLT